MKENVRRPLLFLITVGTGSLIIVIDASVEVIVAGTVLAGFCALLVTGALDPADLKPSRLRAALRERPKKEKKKKTDPAAPKPPLIQRLASTEINLAGMLGTLTASIREAITHAHAPEGEKKKAIEEIDAMLDQAVDGSAPDQAASPTPPKAAGGAVDPLAALADLDLDSLDNLDLDEATGPETAFESDQISLLSEEETNAVSEILKAHQSELEDLDLDLDLPGDSGTAGDLSERPDMSALSAELSALDDLDLDEIEIEGEEVDDEEIDADEPAPEEEVPDEPGEPPEEDFDMVSFASGGMVDDDLIAALKSDVKKKKFVEDISLVRELRGEKYSARELAGELEEILATLKSK